MATTTGQHQLTAFTTPVNGTSPIDADEVRTNDATIRTAYNAHDSDSGIHVQSSVIGSRPSAGTSGRKWLTVDALSAPTSIRAFYDDGTNWYELSYLSTAGGTVAGNLSVTGTLGVTGAGTFGDSVAAVNNVTVTRVSGEVDIFLTRTGVDALQVYLYNAGTAAGFYDGTNVRGVWVYEPSPNRLSVNSALVAGSTLAVTGAITASSTINGQTISSSANLTGSLTVATGILVNAAVLNNSRAVYVQSTASTVASTLNDGITSEVNIAHTSGTMALANGLVGYIAMNGSGGTITDMAAIIAIASRGAGTITNAYGLWVASLPTTGVTTNYGVYVGNINGATTNYAIYTAGGRINFQGLPTSAAGLAAGTLWNNSGVINVA